MLDRLAKARRSRTATLLSGLLFLVAGGIAIGRATDPPALALGGFFAGVGVLALYYWATGESVVTTLRRGG